MIDIKTPLPGPKAREVIARDSKVVSQSYTRDPRAPVVAERASGVWVWDVDGNRFLDFAAGIAVCSTGHCHPQIVQAVADQATQLIHLSGTDFFYLPQIELAEKLVSLVPGDFSKRVFFANSGAEAVEAALKLARYKTRRPNLIAFHGAFHGRTMGAMALSASKPVHRKGFSPLMPGVIHVPYPYCYRCPFGRAANACSLECLDYFDNTVFTRLTTPDEVAAVFIEPIQGEGGYVPAPLPYLQGLREITRRHGILLVVDEVQSGMGRTGKMFAFEWADIEPDIICLAKGIASGLPLGLIIYRADERDWAPGAHASTFGGNPVACAAALKTIELLETYLMANAHRQGAHLLERLQQIQSHSSSIGDIRGRGLMVGVEIVRDPQSRGKAPVKRNEIVARCYQHGLIILGCGENSIRFIPPLTISRAELDEGIDVFAQALHEVESEGLGETPAALDARASY